MFPTSNLAWHAEAALQDPAAAQGSPMLIFVVKPFALSLRLCVERSSSAVNGSSGWIEGEEGDGGEIPSSTLLQ